MTIEETFRNKTLEAIADLDFSGDIPEDVLLANLITDLQVRAYAMGKITEQSNPVVEEETLEYEPQFAFATIDFADGGLVNCYDCGVTVNAAMIDTHINFHLDLNDTVKHVVTGFIGEVANDQA